MIHITDKRKRITSLLLAFVMVLVMLPLTSLEVQAAETTYIKSVAVAYSKWFASSAKSYLTDNGYTVINKDLNDGEGGWYIYMGYKTTTDPDEAITGIRITTDSSDSYTINGVTFYRLGSSDEPNGSGDGVVNLNGGTKLNALYTFVTRDTKFGAPITDIKINTNESESGYTSSSTLNPGASSSDLYLHYKSYLETASATYYYFTSSGTRTTSVQSATMSNHLEEMTSIPSYPTTVSYSGYTLTFQGWREDTTAAAPTVTSTAITAPESPKTFYAVYKTTVTLAYNLNGGVNGPANQTATQYINVGSTSVARQSLTFTLSSVEPYHPSESKCFNGWGIGPSSLSTTTGGSKWTISQNLTLYANWKSHTDSDGDGCCDNCGWSTDTPSLVDGIYQISNKQEMIWFMQYVHAGNPTASAVVTADIDMEGYEWTPICSTGLYYNTTTYSDAGYQGTFDGQGHVISNFTVKGVSGTKSSYGLFGTVSGIVKNLGVDNMTFQLNGASDIRAGGIVGQLIGGTVNNCFVINSTIDPQSYVTGGIAGCNYGGTISNCYTYGNTISGTASRYGAIVGDNRGDLSTSDRPGTVTNCYTDGDTPIGSRTGTVNDATTMTDEQFASGEVTYKLNSSVTNGTQRFYQTVGTGLPAFSGKTVYYGYISCKWEERDILYNNVKSGSSTQVSHSYDSKGFCTNSCMDRAVCGAYQPCTGEGAEASPYKISNAGQMMWFAAVVSGGYEDTAQNKGAWGILANDIDMSGVSYSSITSTALYYKSTETDKGYTGTFDGKGFVIKNLTVTGSATEELSYGLFGTLSGTVQNLGMENFYFSDGGKDCRAGAIAGQVLSAGYIKDCYVVNSTVSTNGYIAGAVAGCVYGGTIENCHSYKNTVTGHSRIGNLVGDSRGDYSSTDRRGYVINCYTDASRVAGTQNGGSNYIKDCEANVSLDRFASGEIAWLLNGSSNSGVWTQTIGTDAYPNFKGKLVWHDTTYGTNPYVNEGSDTVYIVVSWTEMSFTYTESREWEPETHTYTDTGEWSKNSDAGKVTVENYGAKSVAVGFTFLGTMNGISGSFSTATAYLPYEFTVTSTLSISGTPEETDFVNKQIGTATVTVGRNAWKAGDRVAYVAKDGKTYMTTVAEVTDSKAVLIGDTHYSKTDQSIIGISTSLENVLKSVGARHPIYGEAVYTAYYFPRVTNQYRSSSDFHLYRNNDITYYWRHSTREAEPVSLGDHSLGKYQKTVHYYYIWDVYF